MLTFLKNVLTARDNTSYSLTKLVAIGAALDMLLKFYQSPNPDFQAFGFGVASMMAALAGKYFVEDKDPK